MSGLSRSGITPDGYEDFIQTDASINPGNSGGALVNLKGELIGINTAILSRSGGNIGIGFAIPVNMAHNVMDQLVKFGSVKRGLLGVNIYNVTPDIAQLYGLGDAQGALVSQVVEGSAADKAGIKTGDVITTVNGQTVKSNTDLRIAISQLRVGQNVDVGIIRDGKPRKVIAVISDSGAAPVAKESAPKRIQRDSFGFRWREPGRCSGCRRRRREEHRAGQRCRSERPAQWRHHRWRESRQGDDTAATA